MEVYVEPKIMELVSTVEKDFSKAVSEALNLWLRERIIICPITKRYCINHNVPCNECPITKQ